MKARRRSNGLRRDPRPPKVLGQGDKPPRGAELAIVAMGLHAPHPQGHALHPYVQLLPGESPGISCVRRGTVPCVPPARWSLSINFKWALDQAPNSQLSQLNGLPGQALVSF